VDILSLSEPLKISIKKEQEEKQEETKFYLPPTPGSEFVSDITQKVGSHVVLTDDRSGVRWPDVQPHKLSLPE
jgi:hypothetical protein